MLKYYLFLLLRFLLLESFVVFSIVILYTRIGLPFITCISLAFCAAFFLGRLDMFLFPLLKKISED